MRETAYTLRNEAPLPLGERLNLAVEQLPYAACKVNAATPREEIGNGPQDVLCLGSRVIRTLLSRRQPVLTPMVALVADLQQSRKICAELPPGEYFELINQIRTAASDVFQKCYGTEGKHAGDGMVYYFLPREGSNYLFDAAVCAMELKAAIARLSKEWQLRKNWLNELYLNIGLNEGHEWLGALHMADGVEIVALGETANVSTGLSRITRFGRIWATKNFMSKLPEALRDCIEFGIERIGAGGQRVMITSTYSRVDDLLDARTKRRPKPRNIAGLSVTEIRNVSAKRGY